jgi:histidine triad (HIT) family protein
MSTLFTRILNGEIPGRFVWREDDVSAFLTTGPLADGHTLVVPTEEVDRWTDASPETLARVMEVARRIGAVQVDIFDAPRAGLIVAGYEINHLHVHVWPSRSMADFNFASADQNPDTAVLDANAEKLRRGLREAGWGEFVPAT